MPISDRLRYGHPAASAEPTLPADPVVEDPDIEVPGGDPGTGDGGGLSGYIPPDEQPDDPARNPATDASPAPNPNGSNDGQPPKKPEGSTTPDPQPESKPWLFLLYAGAYALSPDSGATFYECRAPWVNAVGSESAAQKVVVVEPRQAWVSPQMAAQGTFAPLAGPWVANGDTLRGVQYGGGSWVVLGALGFYHGASPEALTFVEWAAVQAAIGTRQGDVLAGLTPVTGGWVALIANQAGSSSIATAPALGGPWKRGEDLRDGIFRPAFSLYAEDPRGYYGPATTALLDRACNDFAAPLPAFASGTYAGSGPDAGWRVVSDPKGSKGDVWFAANAGATGQTGFTWSTSLPDDLQAAVEAGDATVKARVLLLSQPNVVPARSVVASDLRFPDLYVHGGNGLRGDLASGNTNQLTLTRSGGFDQEGMLSALGDGITAQARIKYDAANAPVSEVRFTIQITGSTGSITMSDAKPGSGTWIDPYSACARSQLVFDMTEITTTGTAVAPSGTLTLTVPSGWKFPVGLWYPGEAGWHGNGFFPPGQNDPWEDVWFGIVCGVTYGPAYEGVDGFKASLTVPGSDRRVDLTAAGVVAALGPDGWSSTNGSWLWLEGQLPAQAADNRAYEIKIETRCGRGKPMGGWGLWGGDARDYTDVFVAQVQFIVDNKASRDGPAGVAFGAAASMARTIDSGAHWQAIRQVPRGAAGFVGAAYNRRASWLIGVANGALDALGRDVLISSDRGKTWTAWKTGATHPAWMRLAYDRLWIGAGRTLRYSDNCGKAWAAWRGGMLLPYEPRSLHAIDRYAG